VALYSCLNFGKDYLKHPDAIEILSIIPDRSLFPKFKQLYKATSVFRGDLIYDSRPICALNSFITCAASKFLHELLKPVLNCIKEPTIVTSSREAFANISNLVLPDDCFLASFDVKALYPSIPIPLACSLLQKLLLELPNCYSPVDVPLIVELVESVLTTNIVNFKGDLFLQTLGGAMGSSCFPSIAIIFLYMIERSLVRSVLGSSCLVFKRYLDDMFAVFTSKTAALSFFTRYNSLVQGIEITWSNEVDGGVVFLDLLFFKGPRFLICNSLDSKLYQKPNNAFLYLHFKSFHSESARTSWVVDRLKTMVRYCSSLDDYLSLRRQFAIRLRSRSFSMTKVESLFGNVDYSMRRSLLLSPKTVKSKSFRWFVPQTYCPSSVIINLKQILKKNWKIFLLSRFFDPDTIFSTLPTISNVSDISLGHIVNKINARGYKKLV